MSDLHLLSLFLACSAPLACQQQMNAVAQRNTASDVGTLVAAARMNSVRAAHTATALPDGRVLVAGGFTGAVNAPDGAEVYDPSFGRFVATGPMATPRHSHTATVLADGRVLVAGGYGTGGAYLSSVEIYDPVTGTFAAAGELATARAGHAAVRLRDDRVLFIGGVGSGWTFLASSEIYDPARGTFSPAGAMSVPRESHVAVMLSDGRVLVIGGHQGRRADIELYASVEVYDAESGVFSAAGNMLVRRHKHDAVRLPDGRVLITGGSDERDDRGRYANAEIFDPRTGSSSFASDMRLPRYKHAGASVVLPDGRVLIAGGAPQAELYDPGADTFVLVPGDARMAGQFSAIAQLPGGAVLVTGGYGTGLGPQSGAWLYRP